MANRHPKGRATTTTEVKDQLLQRTMSGTASGMSLIAGEIRSISHIGEHIKLQCLSESSLALLNQPYRHSGALKKIR